MIARTNINIESGMLKKLHKKNFNNQILNIITKIKYIMENSKSNFKTIYFAFIGEIIAGIIILILTYILSLNLILFIILVILLISIFVLTYVGYLICIKSNETSKNPLLDESPKKPIMLNQKCLGNNQQLLSDQIKKLREDLTKSSNKTLLAEIQEFREDVTNSTQTI